jgi:mono/diheme cytochrome c family protein
MKRRLDRLNGTRATALRAVLALSLLGCLGVACNGTGESPPDADAPTPAARGEAWFTALCADCHGATGAGDGPAATALSTPPADLRGIAARNGGLFIADAVASYIDGRRIVAEHGSREMPVWGRTLDDRNAALGEERKLTEPIISDIAAYIRTLQDPPL